MEDIWKNLPEMSAPTPGPGEVVMGQEVCYEGDTSMQSQQENFICILCLKCSGITILSTTDKKMMDYTTALQLNLLQIISNLYFINITAPQLNLLQINF